MTSQPRRIASRISALPSGNDRMPSWGKAMRRRSTTSRISSRSSSRAERDQLGVAHVDVRADEAGALGHLPEDRLARPVLDVLVGQVRLALGPGQDALDERARLVVARLADRQHRVEVDVRVDEGRREEAALRVQLASRLALERAGRPDGLDTIAGDRHVHEFRSGPLGDGVDRHAWGGGGRRARRDPRQAAPHPKPLGATRYPRRHGPRSVASAGCRLGAGGARPGDGGAGPVAASGRRSRRRSPDLITCDSGAR